MDSLPPEDFPWEKIFSPEEMKKLHFMPDYMITINGQNFLSRPQHFRDITRIRKMFLNDNPVETDYKGGKTAVYYILHKIHSQVQYDEAGIPEIWYFVRYVKMLRTKAVLLGLIETKDMTEEQFKEILEQKDKETRDLKEHMDKNLQELIKLRLQRAELEKIK